MQEQLRKDVRVAKALNDNIFTYKDFASVIDITENRFLQFFKWLLQSIIKKSKNIRRISNKFIIKKEIKGMSKKITTVPNQRTIKVSKSATDKAHKYTTNNLEALAEASKNLQTLGGFKLYMYLAKNQGNFELALSSADFKEWSGLGYRAYTTAFEELLVKGYLVPLNNNFTHYFFRDKLDIPTPPMQNSSSSKKRTLFKLPY